MPHSFCRPLVATAIVAASLVVGFAQAAEAPATAEALISRFQTLSNGSKSSPFDIPLYIESREGSSTLAGDVHASIDHPFAAVRDELGNPRAWCGILMLHPNVKGCSVDRGDASLTVLLGSSETPVTFGYQRLRSDANFLDVRLHAPAGPFGTTNYRFRIQATPLAANRTLLHLAYSHGYGMAAKLALQTYFNTFGRDKVGFTVVGRTADGKPLYVDNLRGGLERNAMRYYLAIQAWLDGRSLPEAQRLERGLQRWLAQTERYAAQLKEENGYVERKRDEIRRYQSGA